MKTIRTLSNLLSVFWLGCAYTVMAKSFSPLHNTYYIRTEGVETCGVNVGSGTITCDTDFTGGCCLVNNFWECCPAGSVCDTTGGVGTHYCDPGTQCAFGNSKYCYRNDVCCSRGSASTIYECCRECADDKIGCKEDAASKLMITAIIWSFVSFGICLIMCGACYGGRMKMMEEGYHRQHPDGLDEHGNPVAQVTVVHKGPQYVPQYGDGGGPTGDSVQAFDVEVAVEPATPSGMQFSQQVLRKPDYLRVNRHRSSSGSSAGSRDSRSSSRDDEESDGGTLCDPRDYPARPKYPKKTVRVIQATSDNAPYPADPYADKHHYAHPQPHIPNHRSTSPPPRGHAVEVHLGERNTATLAYDNEDDEDYSAHMRYEAATAAAIAARNRDKQRHNLQHNADGTWEISDQGVDNDPRHGNGRHNHIHVDNNNNNNRRY